MDSPNNSKKNLIVWVSLGILVILVFLYFNFKNSKNTERDLTFQRTEIPTIENTDENTNETVIIKSDAGSYSGISDAEVYFSAQNIGTTVENFDFQLYFPRNLKSGALKIERMVSGTWQALEVKEGKAEHAISKKPIPQEFESKNNFNTELKPNDIVHFRAIIYFPESSSGEFWIEAIGNKNGYGLLDPLFSSVSIRGGGAGGGRVSVRGGSSSGGRVSFRGGGSSGGDSFTGTTLYVNTSSSAGGDCTTNNTAGATRACATLLEAINLLPATLTTPYRIYASGSVADTSAINQTPFDQTTSAANYLWIIGEQSPNHFSNSPTGKYDTNKYRLEVTNTNALYNNTPGHLRIEGIQIKITRSAGDSYIGIKCSNANQNYADVDCRISNNIVTLTGTKGNTIGINNRPAGLAGATVKVWNNLVYDFGQCFATDLADTDEYYNNTSAGCTYGFVTDVTSTKVVNHLVTGATIGFVGTFAGTSNYNAEDDGNGAPGANSRSATTFTFVNAGAKDYHLQAGDAGAKDFGTNSVGGLFTTDIDGQTRSGSWDIGADEQQ